MLATGNAMSFCTINTVLCFLFASSVVQQYCCNSGMLHVELLSHTGVNLRSSTVEAKQFLYTVRGTSKIGFSNFLLVPQALFKMFNYKLHQVWPVVLLAVGQSVTTSTVLEL